MSCNLSGSYVIVSYAYGGVSVEPATLANAMKLFNDHKDTALHSISSIIEREHAKTLWIFTDLMARALQAVIRGEGYEEHLATLFYGRPPKNKQGDPRPAVAFDPSWRIGAFEWFINKYPDMAASRLQPYMLDNLDELIDAMPWLEPIQGRAKQLGCEAVLVEPALYDMAREYMVIEQGRWKEDAPEYRIAARILAFVHRYLVDQSDWRFLGVEKIQ